MITHDSAELKSVCDVISSGQWAGGIIRNKTEEQLSSIFNCTDAALVSSGLSALRLALLALGVKEGDKVIVPAYSCVALPNAVLSVGATPYPVDIDQTTFNIENINRRAQDDAKAIICVNTFGTPCRLDTDLPVIEDCSHGFQHHPCHISGDIAVFSFYATKLIAGSEGGGIISNDKSVIDFCKDYRDYTDKAPNKDRLNDKITDISAALIGAQLSKIDILLNKRYEAAERYNELLQDLKVLTPTLSTQRVWYRYSITLRNGEDIEKVIQAMDAKGVSARKPIENWLGEEIKHYPMAKAAYEQVLSLPLYPRITSEEQEIVANILKDVLS